MIIFVYMYTYIHMYMYIYKCIEICIGVCRCVNLRNGKSDSVRLRCDANALRMRCDAKLCVRVKRRDFRSWGFKWAMAVPCRAVPGCGVTPLVASRNNVLIKNKVFLWFLNDFSKYP